MAQTLLLVRDGPRLAPADPWCAEAIDAMPHGQVMLAKLTRPRNVKHHRKWGLIMSELFKIQDEYPTFETFHFAVKQAMNYGNYVRDMDGREHFVPRSISFAQCDQAQFEQFYIMFERVVLERILPNISRTDFRERIAELLGVETPEHPMEDPLTPEEDIYRDVPVFIRDFYEGAGHERGI